MAKDKPKVEHTLDIAHQLYTGSNQSFRTLVGGFATDADGSKGRTVVSAYLDARAQAMVASFGSEDIELARAHVARMPGRMKLDQIVDQLTANPDAFQELLPELAKAHGDIDYRVVDTYLSLVPTKEETMSPRDAGPDVLGPYRVQVNRALLATYQPKKKGK